MHRATRRKQIEGIEVRVGTADAYTQVHVRDGVLRIAGRPGIGEGVSLPDRLAAADTQCTEVRERDLVVAARDRDGESITRCESGERDRAHSWRTHDKGAFEADIDPTMLAAGVRVTAHREAAEHRAVSRPGPRPRRRTGRESGEDGSRESDGPSRCPSSEHCSNVA